MTAVSDALASLNSFNSTRQSAADISSTADAKYGIDDLTGKVNDLRGLTNSLTAAVQQVDPSVTGRTAGSLVNEAQRSALVSREQAPILNNLNNTNTQYGQEQQQLQSAQSLSSKYASALLQDNSTKYQSLTDQYNAAVTQQKEDEANQQWWANFNQQKAQFDAQMAQSQKQLDAQIKASQTSVANLLASMKTTPTATPAATAAATPTINKTYTNSKGQVTGYETPYATVLTDIGQQEQAHDNKVAQRNWSGNLLGGLGDWTGWW